MNRTAISNRMPVVVVEYDCYGKRKSKELNPHFKLRSETMKTYNEEIKSIRQELTTQSSKVANLASRNWCELKSLPSITPKCQLRRAETLIDEARKILFDLEE